MPVFQHNAKVATMAEFSVHKVTKITKEVVYHPAKPDLAEFTSITLRIETEKGEDEVTLYMDKEVQIEEKS